MRDPVAAVEYEAMVFGRHLLSSLRLRGGSRLERSAYLLLSRLDAEGPMSLAQLSEAFGLDVSTLNRQTRALIDAGHAERIPDPDGGLARKVRVTEAGAAVLRAQREAHVAGLRRVLAGWDPDEVEAFATVLERFNTDIEGRDGRTWPRPAPAVAES